MRVLERRRLKRHAARVYASMLGETDEFRDKINAWENTYLNLRLVRLIARYGLALATLAVLAATGAALVGGVDRGQVPLLAALGVIGSLIVAVVLASMKQLKHEEAYQRTASIFISFRRIENLTLFPFTRRAKRRRDAHANKSGDMVRAVERRIQIQPQLISNRAEMLSGETGGTRAARFGLTPVVGAALGELSPQTPAVRIDKFFERKRVTDYLRTGFRVLDPDECGRNYFLLSRGVRNAIKAGLLLWEREALMRDERRNNPGWRRSYITAPNAQVTVLKENEDMRLRFRNASPHLAWPDANDPRGDYETATHLVIECVQNPMELPIHLISVSDIIGRIDDAIEANRGDQGADVPGLDREAVMARLLSNAPVMFSRWNTAILRHRDQTPNNQPILANLSDDPDNPDYVLRWDANRIDWSSFDDTDQELRFSFAVLLRAIELAGQSAERCVLTRGDALVIDNLRCLAARREFCRSRFWPRLKYAFGVAPAWELKAYSGFRPVRLDPPA